MMLGRSAKHREVKAAKKRALVTSFEKEGEVFIRDIERRGADNLPFTIFH